MPTPVFGSVAALSGDEPARSVGFGPQARPLADERSDGLKAAVQSRFVGSDLFLFDLLSSKEQETFKTQLPTLNVQRGAAVRVERLNVER